MDASPVAQLLDHARQAAAARQAATAAAHQAAAAAEATRPAPQHASGHQADAAQ
jgi:hypothetical protein